MAGCDGTTTDVRLRSLEKVCNERGWTVHPGRQVPYGVQMKVAAGGEEASVTLYRTGKALVQGREGPLVDALREWSSPGWPSRAHSARGAVAGAVEFKPSAECLTSDLAGQARIGMDESGKGDYFGPLVTAAVYVDAAAEVRLADMGVADSKRLTDNTIMALCPRILELCPANVVIVQPDGYNSMYATFGNLNRMLAAVHAECLEGLLKTVACDTAIADQFAAATVLTTALRERGCRIRLVQRHRAESDMAVAAASVIARREFVRAMDELSASADIVLPKGSSDPAVIATAATILRRGGRGELARYAKLHFAITEKAFPGGDSD